MEADVAFPFCPSPLSPCLRAARWKGRGLLLHAVPYRNHLRKYEPFPPLSCHSFLEPRRLSQRPATLIVTSVRFGCDGLQRSPQASFVFSRNGAVSPREIVTAGAAGPGALIGVAQPHRGPTVARRWLLEPCWAPFAGCHSQVFPSWCRASRGALRAVGPRAGQGQRELVCEWAVSFSVCSLLLLRLGVFWFFFFFLCPSNKMCVG